MKQDSLDFFLHAIGALFRARRIYPPGKKQVHQAAAMAAQRLAAWEKPVRIALLGDDVIIEDRRIEVLSSSFQALFQALQQSDCESVQIDADAGEDDLTAWIEHVVSKQKGPYRSLKITSGSMNLEKTVHSTSVLAQAVTGYIGFLSQAQEAIAALECKKSEGLVRAREIVFTIAARIAVGKELFEPIRELKDFDDYTFTHALNVCMLSSALARALNASQETVNTISLAALCHDLGKKEVPKEVLNKRGALDPEERLSIEKHSADGARLLLETPGIESENPLLPVVAFQHHMGADYSGYPNSPGVGRLHAASLLVAVADVYDALRTIRPYRPALTVARASTLLIQEAMSGKLYREYVAAFLLLLKVLIPGRRVVLTDGSSGILLEMRPDDVFCPIVETENGQVFDLSDPSGPQLSEIREEST
jgi:HD-GYP domain-containing protein (c-di-GMP phosphodiesterase class II)